MPFEGNKAHRSQITSLSAIVSDFLIQNKNLREAHRWREYTVIPHFSLILRRLDSKYEF